MAISWRRVIVASAILLLGASFAVLGPVAANRWRLWQLEQAERPNPKPSSIEEWREIINVLRDYSRDFDAILVPPPPPPENSDYSPEEKRKQRELIAEYEQAPIVLQTTSPALCAVAESFLPRCPRYPPGSADIAFSGLDGDRTGLYDLTVFPLKLRRELVMANAVTMAVPIPNNRRVISATKEEIEAVLDHGWHAFDEKYHLTAGVMKVGRPVLSEDGHALVYAEQGCGGTCGHGTLYLLERSGSGWKLVRRARVWVS